MLAASASPPPTARSGASSSTPRSPSASCSMPLLKLIVGGQRLTRRPRPRLHRRQPRLVGDCGDPHDAPPGAGGRGGARRGRAARPARALVVADAALAGVRAGAQTPIQSSPAGAALPDLGLAAELVGLERCRRSPRVARACAAGGNRRPGGACSNCIRAIRLAGWAERYREAGLRVIGVHTPEFAFGAHDPSVVRGAIDDLGIGYPVALDQERATWHAYGNHWWPALYLIDRAGHLRARHIGEDRARRSRRRSTPSSPKGAASRRRTRRRSAACRRALSTIRRR